MEKLNEDFIINLSNNKGEPLWMKNFRLNSYKKFLELDNPSFGPKINIDFDNLVYHKGLFAPPSCSWENVDKKVKNTFNDLGVIEAENKYLKGVSNQYESEVVYHKMEESDGIIFLSTDEALKKYPELFEKYFNKDINENDYQVYREKKFVTELTQISCEEVEIREAIKEDRFLDFKEEFYKKAENILKQMI